MKGLTERQARNVRWAIINKGPDRLHPSLEHLQLLEETWIVMSNEMKKPYVDVVMQCDVRMTVTPAKVNKRTEQTFQAKASSGLMGNT